MHRSCPFSQEVVCQPTQMHLIRVAAKATVTLPRIRGRASISLFRQLWKKWILGHKVEDPTSRPKTNGLEHKTDVLAAAFGNTASIYEKSTINCSY